MIKFRQKQFSEYDAMRSLYVELMRGADRSKFGIIDTSSLIPVLRGNNVVIEKFTIVTSLFGKDKYRMYLKVGAKAKMPDEVRLPGRSSFRRLGNMQLNFNNAIFAPGNEDDNFGGNNGGGGGNNKGNNSSPVLLLGSTEPPKNDTIKDSEERNNNRNNRGGNNKGNNNRGNNGRGNKRYQKNMSSIMTEERIFADNNKNDKKKIPPFISSSFSPSIDLSYEVNELLGDAVRYDKKERSLVLDFDSIRDAISALNILPFGLGYKIYLLNS